MNRGQPVVLHGDGSPTRRYLFAGDAADAFDTILHKGAVGQIYNVGSYDEISNISLCSRLLACLDIPHATQEDLHKWIKHTHDRPFNDRRYAVDGTKLRKLGWDQKTTFEEGLKITVDWYKKYGEQWWGDITKVLTPFPEVANKKVVDAKEVPIENIVGDIVDNSEEMSKKRKLDGATNGHTDAMQT